jgi:hypothetical protein
VSASPAAAAVGRASNSLLASIHPLTLVALLGGVAGLMAVVVRLVHSFDHGIWLVAYLLLVGCLAPGLLAAGERRLLATPLRDARAPAVLWLVGVAAVPAGVLADARILVCAGAVCLIVSLLTLRDRAFGGGATPAPDRSRPALAAHGLLIVAMAVSTGIGVLLAWDQPWM